MLRCLALVLAALLLVIIVVGLVRKSKKKCNNGEINSIPINLVIDDESNIEDIRKYMRDGRDE